MKTDEIIENENNERKKILKNSKPCRFSFKKIAIGVAIFFIVSVATHALSGCTPEENKPEPTEVLTKQIEETIKDIMIGQNYTANYKKDDFQKIYMFDKTKYLELDPNNSIDKKFYEKKNNKNYSYVYNIEDEKYHKTETEAFDLDSFFLNPFLDIEYTSYDKESETAIGTYENKEVSLSLKYDGIITVESKDGTLYIVINNSGSTKVTLPSAEEIIDETIVPIPFDKINSFTDAMKGANYLTTIKNKDISQSYYLNGNKLKYEIEGEQASFYSVENDEIFDYIFDETDNKWHKRVATQEKDLNNIYKQLKRIQYTLFDPDSNLIYGTLNGERVSVKIEKGTFTLTNLSNGGMLVVSNVGGVNFELPSGNELIDDTKPVEINEIYSTDENGNIVYKMDAIAEMMSKWIEKENSYNTNIIGHVIGSSLISLDKMLYIDVKDNEVEFGMVYNRTGYNSGYVVYHLNDENVLQALKNGDIKTKAQLLEILKPVTLAGLLADKPTEIEYTTESSNIDEKEEFKKLTENVFNKITNKGVQISADDDNPNTKIDLLNAEILFGFRSPKLSAGKKYDLGYVDEWTQYYIIKKDNSYSLIALSIASSITYNEDTIGNVKNNEEGSWYIVNAENKSLTPETGKIYESAIAKTAKSNSTNVGEATCTYFAEL